MVDLQIVGGGAAGLCAALYAARAGLSVRVFDRAGGGGQMTEAAEIANYPGVGRISGVALAEEFCRAAVSAGAEIVTAEVSRAERCTAGFALTAGGARAESAALILANGAQPRRLAVPGEQEYLGSGVSYCAVCDGRFYGGKTVAVIGGGDSALSEALYLSSLAARVYLIHRGGQFRGSQALLSRLAALPQTVIYTERTLCAIRGGDQAEKIDLCHTDGTPAETLAVNGVFIAVGRVPDNGRFANLIEPDFDGYFPVGADCRTRTPGLFVAGDTRQKRLRQVIFAAADGAQAAEHAREYLAERAACLQTARQGST